MCQHATTATEEGPMTFEVLIAGHLDRDPERVLMGRLIGDLNKKYSGSSLPVSLIVGPKIAGTLPDALLNFGGRIFILELKPVDESFTVELSGEHPLAYTLAWDHPERVRLDRDIVKQVIRYHEAIPKLLFEILQPPVERPDESTSLTNVPCWIVVSPGNASKTRRQDGALVSWFDVLESDSLVSRLEAQPEGPVLSPPQWASICRRIDAEPATAVGMWLLVLNRKFPPPASRNATTDTEDMLLPASEVDPTATLKRIATEGLTHYIPWVAKVANAGPEGDRQFALQVLVTWHSDLACPSLLRALESGAAEERDYSLKSLKTVKCPAAAPLLEKQLEYKSKHLDALIQAYVTCAGGDAYPKILSLKRQMLGVHLEVEDDRWSSLIKGFQRFSGDLPAEELVRLYQTSDNLPSRYSPRNAECLKSDIIDALGRMDSPVADRFLLELLKDVATAESALSALAAGPHPLAVPALGMLLDSKFAEIKNEVGGGGGETDHRRRENLGLVRHALVRSKTREATKVLLHKLESLLIEEPPESVGDNLAFEIVHDVLEENRQRLEQISRRVLTTEKALNHDRAMWILGMVANADSIPTLWDLLKDPRHSEYAAETLGHMGVAEVRARGFSLLESGDPTLRAAGVRIARESTNGSFQEWLVKLARDLSPLVRRAVCEVYGFRDTPADRHRLVPFLLDPDPDVRDSAWTGSRLTPVSDEDGCRLKVVGGPLLTGCLYVNDACLALGKGRREELIRLVPFDGIKSYAVWDIAPGNQGIWLAVESSGTTEDIALLPTPDAKHPWRDREQVAHQWYPPIRKAIPSLETKCEGNQWKRVRDELPRLGKQGVRG